MRHVSCYRASFFDCRRDLHLEMARVEEVGLMAHPHMHYDPEGPIKRLREICLALPEATEKEAWGSAPFALAARCSP
jgi:hypothetical protein